VKHTGQEIGGKLCEIFKFQSFSVVKICNQCLQTDSTSRDFVPKLPNPLPGFVPESHWGFPSPDPLSYSPKMKILVAVTVVIVLAQLAS